MIKWLIANLEREGSERREPAAIGLVKFVKTLFYSMFERKVLSQIMSSFSV